MDIEYERRGVLKMGKERKKRETTWFQEHKVIRITNEAHSELLKYAGWLQEQTGERITPSIAIEHLAKNVRKFIREKND